MAIEFPYWYLDPQQKVWGSERADIYVQDIRHRAGTEVVIEVKLGGDRRTLSSPLGFARTCMWDLSKMCALERSIQKKTRWSRVLVGAWEGADAEEPDEVEHDIGKAAVWVETTWDYPDGSDDDLTGMVAGQKEDLNGILKEVLGDRPSIGVTMQFLDRLGQELGGDVAYRGPHEITPDVHLRAVVVHF